MFGTFSAAHSLTYGFGRVKIPRMALAPTRNRQSAAKFDLLALLKALIAGGPISECSSSTKCRWGANWDGNNKISMLCHKI